MAAKRGVKRSSKQRAMVSPKVRRAYTGSAFKASPDRLNERSKMYYTGESARQNYNRSTYGPVDTSERSMFSSGQSGNYDNPRVPTRQMAGGRPRISGGSLSADSRKRRKASTNEALQSADVSMMQGYNLEPGQKIKPSKGYTSQRKGMR